MVICCIVAWILNRAWHFWLSTRFHRKYPKMFKTGFIMLVKVCFIAFLGDFLILKWGQNMKKLFCCPALDLFVFYPHYGRQWGYLERNFKMQQKPNLFMHAWPWNWSDFFVAFILTFLILKVFYILLLVCKRALEPFFQCFDIGWSTLDITDDFKPKYLRKGYLCESFNFLRFLGYAS